MTPASDTLWAYAKGELTPAEAAQVKAQLDASPEARAALADVEAALTVLSLVPEPPPMPDALARRVGAALEDHLDEAAARSFSGWWRALVSPRFVLGAVAACALAFVAFRLLEAPSSRPAPVVVVPPSLPSLEHVVEPALPPRPVPVQATVASARSARGGAGALQKAQVLEAGARVTTEKGGSLWLQLPDGTKAGLTGATNVKLARLEEKALTFEVERGSLAMVVPHREDRLLTVRAGEVEVKDLGTRFLVSREEARVVVAVEEGSVEVRTPKSAQVVSAGHAVAWHDGELDDYAWPSSLPTPPPPPTGASLTPPVKAAPVAATAPPTPVEPAPAAPTPDEESYAEPASLNPEDEWAAPPVGVQALTPPPPPVVDAPPDQVVTAHPGARPPPSPTQRPRRNTGFNLKAVEDNLRELERQAHVPFVPVGSSTREHQARLVVRLADVGNCVLALQEADKWLQAPAGDALEEAPLRRMVLQQKVRCLNHQGRTQEALEVQRLLGP